MDILRLLPKDIYDAATGAALPSASNVFATIADVTAGDTNFANTDLTLNDDRFHEGGGFSMELIDFGVVEWDTQEFNITTGLFDIQSQGEILLQTNAGDNIRLVTNSTSALVIPTSVNPTANVTVPIEGMIKGNTTSKELEYYDGTSWVSLVSDLSAYLPLAGGTMTGSIEMGANAITNSTTSFYLGVAPFGNAVLETPGDSGSLILYNNVSGFSGRLTRAPLNADHTWTLPNDSGIVALEGINVSSFVNDAGYLTSIPVGTGGIYSGSGTVPTSAVATLTDDITFKGASDDAVVNFTIRNLSNTHNLTYRNNGTLVNTGQIIAKQIGTTGALFASGRVFDVKGTGGNIGVFRPVSGNGTVSISAVGANDPILTLGDNTDTIMVSMRSVNTSSITNGLNIGSQNPSETDKLHVLGGNVAFEGASLLDEFVFDYLTNRVGIGVAAPDEKLHVVGSIKMVDTNQGAGKVLTSDANGVGSWQTASNIYLANGNTGAGTRVVSVGNSLSFRDTTGTSEYLAVKNTGEVVINALSGRWNLGVAVAGNTNFRIRSKAGDTYNTRYETSSGSITMVTQEDNNVVIGDGNLGIGTGIGSAPASKLTVNGDMEIIDGTKGVIFEDRTTSTRIRVFMDNGVLQQENV